jgi:hypothetical protein
MSPFGFGIVIVRLWVDSGQRVVLDGGCEAKTFEKGFP